LQDKGEVRLLTNFNADTVIKGLAWHPDGKSLMFAANNTLHQVLLDKTMTTVTVEYPVDQLFHWHQDNTLLLNARVDGIVKLVKYDLNSKQTTVLADSAAADASLDTKGRLIFLDTKDVFWRQGVSGPEQITALRGKTEAFRFVLGENRLFGVNKGGLLWSFDLDSNEYLTLRQLDKYVTFISDIKQGQLLITQTIAAKKAIVELSNDNL
jgi:hypothetical protein